MVNWTKWMEKCHKRKESDPLKTMYRNCVRFTYSNELLTHFVSVLFWLAAKSNIETSPILHVAPILLSTITTHKSYFSLLKFQFFSIKSNIRMTYCLGKIKTLFFTCILLATVWFIETMQIIAILHLMTWNRVHRIFCFMCVCHDRMTCPLEVIQSSMMFQRWLPVQP